MHAGLCSVAHRLDRVEAIDWKAAIHKYDKGVTRAQRHRVGLGQLYQRVLIAIKAHLAPGHGTIAR